MSLVLRQETQYLLPCRSKVCYLRLSQYLLKPLLIHAIPTLICQLFYTMHFLTRPTILWNCPPYQGVLLKLNFHLIPLVFRKRCEISDLLILLIHLEAATKVFALFKYIVSGHPRLAINIFNALMSSSLVWSGNNSKWSVLLLLNCRWREECTIFFSFFNLGTICDRTSEICNNYMKWSWSRSSINW